MTVAIAAPATFQPRSKIMTGSNITFAIFPMIIPDIAVFARPSERMMLLNALLMIRNGIPMATIRRYCVAYSTVSALAPIALQTGSAKITIKIMDIIPTASPVQKQNAEACFARSS